MNIFLILLMLTSCAQTNKQSTSNEAQIISLKTEVRKSQTHHATYDEFVLNAPNFSVDQYHEGLRPNFKNKEVSLLCQPASLATTLIQDYKSYPAKHLKLTSLNSEEEIDANALVRELIECTKTKLETGTQTSNTANCLVNLYKAAGVNYEIRIIANWTKESFQHVDNSVKINYRVPKTTDIKKYLKEGYHILGILDFFKPDDKGKWLITYGHILNITGYARQKNWPENLLYLYVTDPDFNYRPSEYPRYHQALLSESVSTKNLPEWTSHLFLEGGTLMGLDDRAFLSGLLIFKLK